MAFSFTPTQPQSQEGQAPTSPQAGFGGATPLAPVGQGTAVSYPDSPWLILHDRDKDPSIGAYVQLILALVAVLSVILSASIYGYSVYLTSSITSKKAELAEKEASFKTYPLEDMRKLSVQMSTLDALLKNYVSAQSPLKFLEKVVENGVVFDKFTFAKDKGGNYTAQFTAITDNYRNLIQQLEALHLTEFSKVAPKPENNNPVDGGSIIKIGITTPIFVQGKLPNEVDSLFLVLDKAKITPLFSASSTAP